MIREEYIVPRTKTLPIEAGDVWEAARQLGYPVAMWRLPEKEHVHLIIALQQELRTVKPELEELPAGFMVSAFSNGNNEEVLFMEGDIHIKFPARDAAITPEPFSDAAGDQGNVILQKAIAIHKERKAAGTTHNASLVLLSAGSDEERYKRIVELGAEAVRSGELFKVVLSRKKEFAITPEFSASHSFFQLEAAYPTAFVSVVYLPKDEEIWLGATPELLVEVTAEKKFRTVALAGTQPAVNEKGDLLPRFQIRWGEKEIEEQALVSRYIIECFKRIRLREYLETGPRSARAGNLYHLKSDFEVDMQAVNFMELGSVMLKLLHPTSAVSGMPKEKATALVKRLEGFDRSYYSGFWGPVNVGGEINLYVNLRTLRIRENVATFFAGAGITANSHPNSEWEETELKCQTLLNIISGVPG